MMLHAPRDFKVRLDEARRLQLFLDYDGTLADFAPTPEHVEPDPKIIALLTDLASQSRIRIMVISGRRLDHIEALLPVPGVLLAGTYGIELRLPDGTHVDRVPYDEIRPVLEAVKPLWQELIGHQEGFFLEDKDWALAIHARHAADAEAQKVLEKARRIADDAATPNLFRILGGHKFLEIGPTLAHKGRTVDYLLEQHSWAKALPVYVGDDDKDEEAFSVIHAHGGLAIKVCEDPCETQADGRLTSPEEVRRWLATLPSRFDGQS